MSQIGAMLQTSDLRWTDRRKDEQMDRLITIGHLQSEALIMHTTIIINIANVHLQGYD